MAVDVRHVRDLIKRASDGLSGEASLDGPLAEAEEAVEAAEAAGDALLLLDALEVRAQALTGLGEAEPEDWLAVERAARVCDAWPRASNALRMQIMHLLDDHGSAAEGTAARLAELAAVHGSPADLAWAEAARAEISFVAGRWDEANAFAMRAIAAANRSGDQTPILRAWNVITPIAAARADQNKMALAAYAYRALATDEAPNTYRRLLDAAISIRFNNGATSALDDDELLGAMSGAAAMPHWLAAIETVIERWISHGDLGVAERALERLASSHRSGSASGLGACIEALLRARLLNAEGALKRGVAAQAWTALEGFSRIGAPWWIAKSIRVIGRAGEATPALRSEALRIERALGLATARV
ncbi:MAG: hypothetical protein ACYDCC_07480 [Actinomycetota bacterium]